jgi:hypothetical protein
VTDYYIPFLLKDGEKPLAWGYLEADFGPGEMYTKSTKKKNIRKAGTFRDMLERDIKKKIPKKYRKGSYTLDFFRKEKEYLSLIYVTSTYAEAMKQYPGESVGLLDGIEVRKKKLR